MRDDEYKNMRFRVWDNGGETLDRYTAVEVGNENLYLGFSENPQFGFSQFGEFGNSYDWPNETTDTEIAFTDLSPELQAHVEYRFKDEE